MSPLVELLAKTDLFGRLASDELATCATLFSRSQVGRGQSLFVRGEQANYLYVVSDGRIRIAIVTDDDRECIP
jgi:CRP-like cAMP-binding protein